MCFCRFQERGNIVCQTNNVLYFLFLNIFTDCIKIDITLMNKTNTSCSGWFPSAHRHSRNLYSLDPFFSFVSFSFPHKHKQSRSFPPPLLDVIICLKLFIYPSLGARRRGGGAVLGFFQSSCEPDSYRQPCYWLLGRRRAMASVWAAESSPVTRHLRSRCFYMHWRRPPPTPRAAHA